VPDHRGSDLLRQEDRVPRLWLAALVGGATLVWTAAALMSVADRADLAAWLALHGTWSSWLLGVVLQLTLRRRGAGRGTIGSYVRSLRPRFGSRALVADGVLVGTFIGSLLTLPAIALVHAL
jgi:hypothetical protein